MDYDILIVDDEERMRESLSMVLEKSGYSVRVASSGETAISQIKKKIPDIVLLDLFLPKISGIETLRRIRDINNHVTVIIITGYGNVKNAVLAMKLGAYDFITKPFNLEVLRVTIQKALENIKLKKEVERLRFEQEKKYKVNYIIGNSQKIKEIYKLIDRFALVDANVLIQGESGTGKELAAQNLHIRSKRASQPFIPINCAAVPKELLESEFFGYEKGSFTDAGKQGKQGIFEQAQGGTIFLDEIGAMEFSLQAKLLRVLETREFRRIGGLKKIKLDARIIAASNIDLKEAVKKGNFREDIYYRLNVLSINMPPLRERKEDIIPLAKSFINEFNAEFHKNVKGISPEVEIAFKSYSWPGNVRELRNLIERIILLIEEDDIVLPQHLPKELFENKKEQDNQIQDWNLERIEKEHLRNVFEFTKGNQAEAARLLGIGRGALRYRIKKYKLDKEKFV